LSETVVSVGIEVAYAQLKAQLIQSNCKIIAEEPPKSVSAVQGSLWGTLAKTAQKKITYTLKQDSLGTHISSHSALTTGYLKLTLAGVVLSFLLMLICAWIALDLQAYASVGTEGVWSWLAQTGGDHVDLDKAAVFTRFMWILEAFLAATLLAEGIIVARVRAKIGIFAEEVLQVFLQR
jgi:hypothetical protein